MNPSKTLGYDTLMRVALSLAILQAPLLGQIDRQSLEPAGTGTGFKEVSVEQSGISFANQVTDETVGKFATLIASGVAAGDVDGDGRCDLYFCRIDGNNVLYRNLGEWKFEDVTAKAGVACAGRHSIGATFADTDGDGDLDLITTARGGATSLFINDGSGVFSEDAGFPLMGKVRAGTTSALADADGDGDLDLYIANYRSKGYGDDHVLGRPDPWSDDNTRRMRAGETVDADFAAQFFLYRGEIQEKGEPDDFLLNDGAGNFSTAPAEAFGGVPEPPGALNGWGLSAQWRDHDLDGDPDLYVCNDFHTPDRMWINDGTGRLSHVGELTQRRQSYYAMAVDFADFDRDHHLDFFVADMMSRDHARKKRQMGAMGGLAPQSDVFAAVPQIMQNTLFRSRGDGTYAEIAQFAGLKASEWTWGTLFMDVDLDGWPDLVTATGMVHDWMDADTQNALKPGDAPISKVQRNRSEYPELKTRNLVFRNLGDQTFKETGSELGIVREEVSGGMAAADLDNDGDLDLVFNNIGAVAEVYRNESTAPRIAVRLTGPAPNTRAVGARVELIGATFSQQAEVMSGGRYASHCDDLLVFAAPPEGAPYTLRVTRRDGSLQEIGEVAANSILTIGPEGARPPAPAPAIAKLPPIFTEDPGRLGYVHRENVFADFARQPLLPNRLSRLGPGISWCDLNGDGDEELLVGASSGETLTILANDGGRFSQARNTSDPMRLDGDATSVVTLPSEGGGVLAYLGISIWERDEGGSSLRIMERAKNGEWSLKANATGDKVVSGPLALGDVNGDGRPDVFVGGRMNSGRYPEPSTSFILLDDDGTAEDPTRWSEPLKQIGMVSGAVMADFDNDGDIDIALAREWDSPTLLLNNGAGFDDVGEAMELTPHRGWWNGIASGDFDGDGRLDLIATNWGENSKYGRTPGPDHPLLVRYGDIDDNGTFDVIEAHQDKMTGKLVPERGLSCSSGAIPHIRKKISSYRAFGEADLFGIYGDTLQPTASASASELRHGVFLNRGDRFEFVPLPREAQWAPAFGVSVADFDGDGRLDAFLAQNFFSVQPETARNDGGRGLLLLGRGDGTFDPADRSQSGIAIYGEQRACAVSDFDHDGRSDLVVTQNDGSTHLFRNSGGRPGLRVRLDAGPMNPSGIGTIVRPVTASGMGPARVVTAGSGYLSQDSPVLVVTAADPIEALEIAWPGGERIRRKVPVGIHELRIQRTTSE